MKQPLGEELKPLADFPPNASSFLEQIKADPKARVYSDEPTRGAVVLDLASYRALKEELALLRDIHRASQEFEAGLGVEHEQAKDQILARLNL